MVKKGLYLAIFALVAILAATTTAEAQEEVNTASVPVKYDVDNDIVYYYTSTKSYSQARENARSFKRDVLTIPFVEQGETIIGASMSYGSLDTENAQMLLILEDIEASGKVVSIKPYIGFAHRENAVTGVRFSYLDINGTLDSASFDLGQSNDVQIDMPYINIESTGYTLALFHRSYTAIDKKGRIGLFAELEFGASWNETRYAFEMGDTSLSSHSKSRGAYLNFNPGASIYIFPNVSTTLSFGLGGLSYTLIDQYDSEGLNMGERSSGKMSFKFNVLAINLGFAIHIW